MRGFKAVSTYEGVAKLPFRATLQSAGYDLFCLSTTIISPGTVQLVPTGVKAYMQEGEVLKVYARSSLALKKQLMLANGVGVVDHDYYNNEINEGHIFVPLYNFGSTTISVEVGEKIAQGLFEKYYLADQDEPSTQKRNGGFGSTGNY